MDVFLEERAGVGHLVLARASALNALSRAFTAEIDEALRRLDGSPEVRAILVTSAAKHFCAGADIVEMEGLSEAEALATGFTGCVEHLPRVVKPVVCAVNGLAAGGGCELVEMCDVVVAGVSARFSHPELTLGAMPGAGGTQRLSRAVGKHVALDVLLTGRALDAREALAAGLVSRVVPDADLADAAFAVAEKIASLPGPVARRIKRCVLDAQIGLDDGLRAEREAFHRCFLEHDFREGLAAFRENRKPGFLHR